MRFDLFSWQEFRCNEEVPFGEGQLRLRLSAPAPVYFSAQGVEALAGFGAAFDIEVSEAVTVRVEAPEGVRAFRWVPPVTAVEPEGEVFTNIDRMPDESGSVAEVLRARRLFEFERRAALRDIRAARDELVARTKEQAMAPEPSAEPEAQPEQEPAE